MKRSQRWKGSAQTISHSMRDAKLPDLQSAAGLGELR